MLDQLNSPITSQNRATLLTLKQQQAKALLKYYEMTKEDEEAQSIQAEVTPQEIAFTKANPFREFIADSWGLLEPGNQFVPGWHIDAIAEHLEACSRGELKNLVINIPPRLMKSMLVCVMWFCWTWTFRPHTRWIFSSYSQQFALRDSNKCRKLIKSKWYQRRFGESYALDKSQETKTRFENSKMGFRLATGVRGSGTGEGGDFIICDDPHKVLEAESTKVVEATINWWHRTMYNRMVNPETTVRIIVMQRISEGDLTGDILAKELNYEHLCLPMTFKRDHQHINIPADKVKGVNEGIKITAHPTDLGTVNEFDVLGNPNLQLGETKHWIDPRFEESPEFKNVWYQEWLKKYYKKAPEGEGELLFPDYYKQNTVDEIAKTLEVYGEEAQLQQQPTPKGGTFFNPKFFTPINRANFNLDDYYILRYWDKAGTEGGGDWTVGVLMARTKKFPFRFIVLNVVRERESVYNRMDLIKATTADDFTNWTKSGALDCDYAVVIEKEAASAGTDLSIIEKDELAGYNVRTEKPTGNKTTRARPFKIALENGRIQLLDGEGDWQATYRNEFQKFKADKENQVDDQVDASSGAYRQLLFMTGLVAPQSSGTTMRGRRGR